jgi:hypothetical protein
VLDQLIDGGAPAFVESHLFVALASRGVAVDGDRGV